MISTSPRIATHAERPIARTKFLAWASSLLQRDLALIFGLSLAVNLIVVALLRSPGYTDAFHYLNGAQRLAGGDGLTDAYLWNYLAADHLSQATPPYPGFGFWMPLTSIVEVGPVWLAGRLGWPDALHAAMLPSLLCAALLPLMAYLIAMETAPSKEPHRLRAVVAALITQFAAGYILYWPATDGFAFYGLFGSACLYAIARSGSDPRPRWLLVAGATAGLAHLTRADGALLLVVALGFTAWESRKAGSRLLLSKLGMILGAYLFVMAPWFARNLGVFGTPLAPGGLRVLWLTTYNQIFAFPASTLTPPHYLSSGLLTILGAKLSALLVNLRDMAFLQGSFLLMPALLLGLWTARRLVLLRPALVYAVVLLIAMSFVFTYPGPRGALFHSSTALLPFAAVITVDGLHALASWLSRRKPQQLEGVFRGVCIVAVVMAIGFSIVVMQARLRSWNHAGDIYATAGAWLSTQPATDAVITADPPALYYETGRNAYAMPDGGIEAVLAVSKAFGARWLLLEPALPDGLRPLYKDPALDPRLSLRETFKDPLGKDVFLFELAP